MKEDGGIVTTTNGTHPCLSETQLFRNGLPSQDGDSKTFEVIIFAQPLGTLCSVVTSLAATLYQCNADKDHHIWNSI
jgi:hypothetical protein